MSADIKALHEHAACSCIRDCGLHDQTAGEADTPYTWASDSSAMRLRSACRPAALRSSAKRALSSAVARASAVSAAC